MSHREEYLDMMRTNVDPRDLCIVRLDPYTDSVIVMRSIDDQAEENYARANYAWEIWDGEQRLEGGCDLYAHWRSDPGPRGMMRTLISFLEAAVEAHLAEMRHPWWRSENSDLFSHEVIEWAYMHDDALDSLAHHEGSPLLAV